LLVGFLVNERRAHDPLMPFHIFRVRTVAGANVVGLLLGAVIFANFFLLTLYVQNVLGYSALETGVTFLATAGTAVVSAGVAQALTTRFGPKPIIVIGLGLLTAGMIWYSQIPVHGSFASDLLPGYLMVGVGIAFAYVPVSIAALAGVAEREAGLASGLINTSQQIGGALGIAALSSIATSTTGDQLSTGTVPAFALTNGFQDAFVAGALVAFVGILVSIFVVRGRDLEEVPEVEPAFEQAA
jgi:MFS family permease